MLLRCLGWWKRRRDDHTLSFADALAKTVAERICGNGEYFSRNSWHAHMGEERQPHAVMFAELVEGKGCSEGQKKDGMVRTTDDMSACGIMYKGCRTAARIGLADSSNGWRMEHSHSCCDGITRRAAGL